MTLKNTLHIYAQRFPHESAEIGGSPDALLALSHAIRQAVESETRKSEQSFWANDGEGYDVKITVVGDYDLDRIRAPYTDQDCRELPRSKRVYPSELNVVTKLAS